jgi:hypothetical protein
MNSYELLILFLVVVVIFYIIKKVPYYYMLSLIALWFSILWICFDNMGMWKKKKRIRKVIIPTNTERNQDIIKKIEEEDENQEIKDKIEEAFTNIKLNNKPAEYSENNYKENVFDDIGSMGDNLLAHKMKQISNKNREAMDNFSRMQKKYSNLGLFYEELTDAANSRWWDNDALDDEF